MNWSFFYTPDAPLVRLYSIEHCIYLAVCAAVIVLFICRRRWVAAHRDLLCKLFLWMLLFQQLVLLYGWYAVVTGFDPAVALPLHICRVASILTLLFLLTRRQVLIDIVCYFSIFALISFFYPMNVYHFAHINGISYMINHLITVLIPIFAILAFDWRPTWATFRNAVIGFCVYFPVALAANVLTKAGNYFYQTDRPFLREMPQWQYAALSFAVTLAGFALVPLAYALVMKRNHSTKDTDA